MAAFHDGANQEASLSAARTAFQNPRSGDNTVGFGDHGAMRADKPVSPADPLEIGSARRVIRKLPLEFGERLGESQVVALVDVHGKHNGQILDVVGVCVNRIGTHCCNPLAFGANALNKNARGSKRSRRLRLYAIWERISIDIHLSSMLRNDESSRQ